MGLRISQSEAKRLGIVAAKKPKATGSGVKPGTTRHKVAVLNADTEFDCIELKIPLRSHVKSRPRIFLNPKAVRDAFFKASGSFEAFMRLINLSSVTPKATQDFELALATAAKLLMGNKPPFDGPVRLELSVDLHGDPSYWPTARNDGDMDNHEKAIIDGLNEIVYTDDRLIVEKSTRIRFVSGPDEIRIKATCLA
jgi:Holliday junction resolvase RusA-like endonuclease